MNAAENQDALFYDVVVIGGALSGAATATLLLRQNSGLRVLIVEKSVQLTRRVGEATVEVSAFLMGRVLGLGGHYQVRLPSYQLDRAAFDEEVLRRACAAGAKLLRPGTVTKVELSPGGEQAITVRHNEAVKTVRTRWIVDA